MHVVAFGTFDRQQHPRIQVLIEGLHDHDVAITELNRPVVFPTEARVAAVRKPWLLIRYAVRVVVAWAHILRASREIRGVDVVVVGYLGLADVFLARLRFPRATVVLDHLAPLTATLADRDLGGRATRLLLGVLERTSTQVADLLLVDTEETLRTLAAPAAKRAIVVPVGAPRAWFRVPAPTQANPRLVFFGLYTPLQGAPVITEALALLHDRGCRYEATMIGHGQDLARARQQASDAPITFINWLPAEELTRVVSEHTVCLGIFGTTPKAHRVVPNKVYQGAAAGCVVVTSNTKPQAEQLGDVGVLVPPGSPSALASAIEDLLRDPKRLHTHRLASYEHAVARFSPAIVATHLIEHLNLAGRDRRATA